MERKTLVSELRIYLLCLSGLFSRRWQKTGLLCEQVADGITIKAEIII